MAATVLFFAVVTPRHELGLPLGDEPIGTFVAEVQAADPEIAAAVQSPRRLLAFRTFGYLRVGMLLGGLLMERDLDGGEQSTSWAERLLEDPEVREQAVAEVRAVAEEIAKDPAYDDDSPLGPGEAERERFLEFAKRRLSADT
jgi:hypothetical protein